MINGLIAQALNSSVSGSSKISPKPDIIRENGTYYATADELDGYSSVTVNVRKKYTTAEDAQSDLDSMAVTPTTTESSSGIPVTFHASATNEASQYAYYGYTTSVLVGYVDSETGEWVGQQWGTSYGQGIKNFKVISYHLEDNGWYCLYSYVSHNFREDIDEEHTQDQWFANADTFGEDMEYILDSPTITDKE